VDVELWQAARRAQSLAVAAALCAVLDGRGENLVDLT